MAFFNAHIEIRSPDFDDSLDDDCIINEDIHEEDFVADGVFDKGDSDKVSHDKEPTINPLKNQNVINLNEDFQTIIINAVKEKEFI